MVQSFCRAHHLHEPQAPAHQIASQDDRIAQGIIPSIGEIWTNFLLTQRKTISQFLLHSCALDLMLTLSRK